MAKKKKDWLSQHNNNVEAYARQVNDLYMELLREVVRIQKAVEYDSKTPFSFSSYPTIKDRVTKLFASFSRNMVGVITDGSKREWALSNAKNNELLNQLFASSTVPEELIDKLKPQNAGALKSFLARKDKGLALSDKVWKYTGQGKTQIENALTVGVGKGTPSTYLAQKMMQYLKEPSLMGVDAGQLHKLEYREELLRRIDSNKPGVGSYKSAYANSMRLARTETNMAYHSADHETYNNWDFVVGIEVRRSNNPFVCPVCESLKGKYPKTFKFRAWHPNCRCHTVPILMTDEEFNAVEVMMLNEEDTSGFVSENAVTSMPAGFLDYVSNNRRKILTAKSKPYFIRDNFDKNNGLKLSVETILPAFVQQTREWAGKMEEKSKEIAKSLHIRVTPVNFKSDRRIIEKADADYGGNISKVRDIIRNTFIVTNQGDYNVTLMRIRNAFNVVKSKTQQAKSDPMGYSGTLMQIKNGRVYAEIQVNTAQMIYGKELEAERILGKKLFNIIKQASGLEHGLGHKFYEEYRILDKSTAEGKILATRLEKESTEYYNKLREIKLN